MNVDELKGIYFWKRKNETPITSRPLADHWKYWTIENIRGATCISDAVLCHRHLKLMTLPARCTFPRQEYQWRFHCINSHPLFSTIILSPHIESLPPDTVVVLTIQQMSSTTSIRWWKYQPGSYCAKRALSLLFNPWQLSVCSLLCQRPPTIVIVIPDLPDTAQCHQTTKFKLLLDASVCGVFLDLCRSSWVLVTTCGYLAVLSIYSTTASTVIAYDTCDYFAHDLPFPASSIHSLGQWGAQSH